MKAALIIGSLGLALAFASPAMRMLRARLNSRVSDEQYFAAARKRAISYRLNRGKANPNDAPGSAGE